MNYLEFKVALQDVEDRMAERGVDVDACDITVLVNAGPPDRITLKLVTTVVESFPDTEED